MLVTQRLQAGGIFHGGVKIVDRAGTDNGQQAAIFAIQNFFNPAAGVGNVTGDGGGNGMPVRKFSGRYQTVYPRGTQFIGSVHDFSQKWSASTAGAGK
ncbi:hypothetical protein SedNR2807_24540 [Citrobacter sedlakii]